jgi:hypothetical protein
LEFEDHGGDDSTNNLRYVLSDLFIGLYIVACLAIDVFVVLQIYDYYPNQIVAALSVVLIIAFAVVQVWVYRIVKRSLAH